jgi:cytochrome c556
MVRTVLVMAVVAVGVTVAIAQSNPVQERKALMKANGVQERIAIDMVQAKRPFDLEEAKKALATFAEAGEKAPALFPDESKDGDTAALPAVWENKADFTARFAKLASVSKAAVGAITDLDSLKVQLTEVRQNCIGCHRTYRKRAS